MRRRVPSRERVHAAELRHHLPRKEEGEDAEVRPNRANRDVHPALEEEEGRQKCERDHAQTLLLGAVLSVVARECEAEKEGG